MEFKRVSVVYLTFLMYIYSLATLKSVNDYKEFRMGKLIFTSNIPELTPRLPLLHEAFMAYVEQNPLAKDLLRQALKNGDITIQFSEMNTASAVYGAHWDKKTSVIHFNIRKDDKFIKSLDNASDQQVSAFMSSDSRNLRTILFELSNAINPVMNDTAKPKIIDYPNAESWAKQCEKVEMWSFQNCARIINYGVTNLKLKGNREPVYTDDQFETYYKKVVNAGKPCHADYYRKEYEDYMVVGYLDVQNDMLEKGAKCKELNDVVDSAVKAGWQSMRRVLRLQKGRELGEIYQAIHDFIKLPKPPKVDAQSEDAEPSKEDKAKKEAKDVKKMKHIEGIIEAFQEKLASHKKDLSKKIEVVEDQFAECLQSMNELRAYARANIMQASPEQRAYKDDLMNKIDVGIQTMTAQILTYTKGQRVIFEGMMTSENLLGSCSQLLKDQLQHGVSAKRRYQDLLSNMEELRKKVNNIIQPELLEQDSVNKPNQGFFSQSGVKGANDDYDEESTADSDVSPNNG